MIGEGLFASNFASWFEGKKKLSRSFESDNSVESLGSLDNDDPLIIVNPNNFTVHKLVTPIIKDDDMANEEE